MTEELKIVKVRGEDGMSLMEYEMEMKAKKRRELKE